MGEPNETTVRFSDSPRKAEKFSSHDERKIIESAVRPGVDSPRESGTYKNCRFRFPVAEFRFRWRMDGGSAGKLLAHQAN